MYESMDELMDEMINGCVCLQSYEPEADSLQSSVKEGIFQGGCFKCSQKCSFCTNLFTYTLYMKFIKFTLKKEGA